MKQNEKKLPTPKFGEFGVYMNNKIEKLKKQNQAATLKSQIFRNLTFHINGTTTPPFMELKEMILINGGKYEQYRLSEVDFFIAEELSESKKKMWEKKKVVVPKFILESIENSKLLEYQSFLLSGSQNFIKEFYKQSRLHYLSLWKSELKSWCSNFKRSLPKSDEKIICHFDLDAFFVSASLLKSPQHRDKPVCVSHGSNPNSSSADIASCNYIARNYGIRNGMSMGTAKKHCPDLLVLPYDFDHYKTISRIFYDILIKNCDEIESVSCDEAFIDISSKVDDLNSSSSYVESIRKTIFDASKITASAGIGHSKLIARIATKKAKPDGLQIFSKSDFQNFIFRQTVDILPGIGWKLKRNMQDFGINDCEKLLEKSCQFLQEKFGIKKGETIFKMVRGIDDRELNDQTEERQSVSAEINWGIRFNTHEELNEFIVGLNNQAVCRLKNEESLCQKCVLKLMVRAEGQPVEPSKYLGHGICDSISFSESFQKTNDEAKILQIVKKLVSFYKKDVKDLRGVGIQFQNLIKVSEKPPIEKPKKRGYNDDFFEEINQSVYDELPSSLQVEVYNNWRREKNENGLLEKLKKARNLSPAALEKRGIPEYLGLTKRKDILKSINDWIISNQQIGPPSDRDKVNLYDYLDLLVEKGYCDFADEIIQLVKYLTNFKSWSREFQYEIRDILLKIQQRYIS
eukprot:NODE_5_length_72347_cov_1.339331.p7 type:complete len:687 gc:universal NODE_5_length_72347_cov_1.339331:20804-18744(-)